MPSVTSPWDGTALTLANKVLEDLRRLSLAGHTGGVTDHADAFLTHRALPSAYEGRVAGVYAVCAPVDLQLDAQLNHLVCVASVAA